MKKILIVNVNWLGDVIFSSPVFRALKAAYPGCHIATMAPSRVEGILGHVADVDQFIAYDDRLTHRSLWAKIRLVRELRRERFDAVFLLHRSLSRACMMYLAGIPIRVGYDTKKRGCFLTHKIQYSKDLLHRSDHYLSVIESFGVKVEDRRNILVVKDFAQKNMADVLSKSGIGTGDFLVILNPGGNWDLKRWPKENYAQLIVKLNAMKGVKMIVSGSSNDEDLAAAIISESKCNVINLAGKMNLDNLVALLARANCLVSADSGPLHIASSVGTSVVGIFGPTSPEITGPRGTGEVVLLQHHLDCNKTACYNLKCDDNKCMKDISVEEVLDAVVGLRERKC
ncbi:lipopolysaccharide heptosyltransferase II [Candidatus Omnitrophota bacterium]